MSACCAAKCIGRSHIQQGGCLKLLRSEEAKESPRLSIDASHQPHMANLDRLSAMANAHQDTHYLLHPPTTVAGAKYHPQERSSSIAQQQRSATPMTNAVREFIMRPRDGYEQASSGAFSRSSSVASLSHLWHGESRHRAPSFSRTLARSHPKVLTLPSFVYTPTCPGEVQMRAPSETTGSMRSSRSSKRSSKDILMAKREALLHELANIDEALVATTAPTTSTMLSGVSSASLASHASHASRVSRDSHPSHVSRP